MADLPKSYTWNGEPIESIPHSELLKLVGHLIERTEADRREIHRRQREAIWVVPEHLRKALSP